MSSGMALAIVVTVLATLTAVSIIAAAVLTVRRMRNSGRKVMSWGWAPRWKQVLFPERGGRADDAERDPLLSPRQQDSPENLS